MTTRLRTLWRVRAAAIRIQRARLRAALERMTDEELRKESERREGT